MKLMHKICSIIEYLGSMDALIWGSHYIIPEDLLPVYAFTFLLSSFCFFNLIEFFHLYSLLFSVVRYLSRSLL